MKVVFSPFWHPFSWFSLREMGPSGVSDQLLGRFTPFLLQWYLFIKKQHLYKNNQNWCGRWWDVADWHWKVGFTPQTIRHGPRSWHFSSSVVLSSSEPGLLLGAQPRKCPLRGPYSIHILKVPSFGASVDHLWIFSRDLTVQGLSKIPCNGTS